MKCSPTHSLLPPTSDPELLWQQDVPCRPWTGHFLLQGFRRTTGICFYSRRFLRNIRHQRREQQHADPRSPDSQGRQIFLRRWYHISRPT